MYCVNAMIEGATWLDIFQRYLNLQCSFSLSVTLSLSLFFLFFNFIWFWIPINKIKCSTVICLIFGKWNLFVREEYIIITFWCHIHQFLDATEWPFWPHMIPFWLWLMVDPISFIWEAGPNKRQGGLVILNFYLLVQYSLKWESLILKRVVIW